MKGGCICGKIRFEIKAVFDCVICHCDECRRTSGSVFVINVIVKSSDFRMVGVAARSYRKAHGDAQFCPDCGAPIGYFQDDGELVAIALGALDDPRPPRPLAQQFWEQRMRWLDELESIPTFSDSRLTHPRHRNRE